MFWQKVSLLWLTSWTLFIWQTFSINKWAKCVSPKLLQNIFKMCDNTKVFNKKYYIGKDLLEEAIIPNILCMSQVKQGALK